MCIYDVILANFNVLKERLQLVVADEFEEDFMAIDAIALAMSSRRLASIFICTYTHVYM